MKKKVSVVLLISFLLVGTALGVFTGCGKNEETVKAGDVTVKYTTDAKKSVELPDKYPKNNFPVYKNAYIMAVQSLDNSYVLTCFSKDTIKQVGTFYKELFKGSQVLAETVNDDEYTVMGVKDGYTYTVCVIANTEEELKDYKTSLVITLVPAPAGMPEGLKNLPGSSPARQ